jgi:hypothetical protein
MTLLFQRSSNGVPTGFQPLPTGCSNLFQRGSNGVPTGFQRGTDRPPPYALASLGLPPPRARDALGVVGFAGASPRPGSLEKSAKTLDFLPSGIDEARNFRSFPANRRSGVAA